MYKRQGLVEDTDAPFLYCETEFVQAMPFVSALRLQRRIELPVGGQSVRLRDTVRNVGHTDSTHMMLYHFNLGFPLVAEGTMLDLGNDTCVWSDRDHYLRAVFGPPQVGVQNSLAVFQHQGDVAAISLASPVLGRRLRMTYPTATLPYCQVFRMAGQGAYGACIEPCTTGARTRQDARAQGEMIILGPGDQRAYDISLDFLPLTAT